MFPRALTLLALASLASACGNEAGATSTPPPARPVTDPMTATRFTHQWWNSDEAQCPDGTSFQGAAPPHGSELWCARPDGVRHGQHLRWYDNGYRAYQGNHRNGAEHGEFIKWYPTGQRWQQGQYTDGRRTGTWFRWQPDRSRSQQSYSDEQ